MLEVRLQWLTEIGRPRVHRRLPTVLSQDEVRAVMRGPDREKLSFVQLLYGTVIRLTVYLNLQEKDIDFHQIAIVVRRQSKCWMPSSFRRC